MLAHGLRFGLFTRGRPMQGVLDRIETAADFSDVEIGFFLAASLECLHSVADVHRQCVQLLADLLGTGRVERSHFRELCL